MVDFVGLTSEKLWRRDFTLLFSYAASSNFASAIFTIALSFLVLKLTGSSEKMAITMAMNLLPNIIRPFTATFFDRINMKLPVILLNVIDGLSLILLFFYLKYFSVNINIVYFVVFLNSLIVAIYEPALPKLIPFVISSKFITKAMGVLTTSNSAMELCGLLSGGFLVSFFGPQFIVLFYGISCMSVTVFLFFTNMPVVSFEEKKLQNNFFYDFWEGIKIVFASRNILFFCVLGFVLDAVLAPLKVLLPIYMTSIGKGEVGYGILMAYSIAGSILGGLIITTVANKIKDLHGVMIAFTILFISFCGLLFFKYYYLFLMFIFLFGIASGMINTYIFVIAQKSIPYSFLSRVIGVINTCCSLGSPIVLFMMKGVIKQITLSEIFLFSLILSAAFLFIWFYNSLSWQKNSK